MPIPTKNLQAVSILNMPTASPLKYEPVAKAVKIIRINVDTTRELVRDQWSEVKPKMSWPTTVPAKAISATYLAAFDLVYTSLYWSLRIVLTDPMTYARRN